MAHTAALRLDTFCDQVFTSISPLASRACITPLLASQSARHVQPTWNKLPQRKFASNFGTRTPHLCPFLSTTASVVRRVTQFLCTPDTGFRCNTVFSCAIARPAIGQASFYSACTPPFPPSSSMFVCSPAREPKRPRCSGRKSCCL